MTQTHTLKPTLLTFSHVTCLICVYIDQPEAKLKLGSSLSADNIREGTDVYFDCVIDANPPVSKVDWRHDVSALFLV